MLQMLNLKTQPIDSLLQELKLVIEVKIKVLGCLKGMPN